MTIINSTTGAILGTPSSGAAVIAGADGVATVGSRHASVSKQQIGTDHTPETEPTVELHTYVQHLESKIDALTRTIENDRGVREELADIRRLLNTSNSRSAGSGRDRRGISPLHDDSDAGRDAARSRRPAKERLGPRASGRSERSANSHDRRSRSPRNDTRDAEKRKSAFDRLSSQSASSTHSARGKDGRRERTPSPSGDEPEDSGTQIFTKGYLKQKQKRDREEHEAKRRERTPVSERLGSRGAPSGHPERSHHEGHNQPSSGKHRSPNPSRAEQRKKQRQGEDPQPQKKRQGSELPSRPGRPNPKRRDARLDRLTSSPFTEEIDKVTPPKGFSQPKFVKYDGATDSYTHLVQYKHIMSLFTQNEALLCKVFPSSLGNLGLTWFNQLPARSIGSFDSLCQAFMDRFVTNTEYALEIDSLLALKKNQGESLRSYAKRYWELFNKIENCDPIVSISSFKLGLTEEDEQVYDDLALTKPRSMEELMQRVEEWSQLFESKAQRGMGKSARGSTAPTSYTPTSSAPKKQVNNIKTSGKKGPRPQEFAAIKTVFTLPLYKLIDEIKDKPYFSFPNNKLGTEGGKVKSPNVRCSYHNEQGHFTTACKPFKAYLEELIDDGHLRNFVNQAETTARAERYAARTEAEVETID